MKKKYLCHIDFFGLYNIFYDKFKKKNLRNIFYEILDELEIEVIYLASFNYDFLKFGKTRYAAPSQLNEISRIIQRKKNYQHTFDPVFSFCTNDNDYKFKIINNFESFGKDSLFDYASKNNMEYLNLGTNDNFISTAIHYSEKLFKVEYRYKKKFIGTYKYKNKINQISYEHTVWPRTKKFCNYNAKKINRDLIKDGIWEVIKSKNGFYVKKAKIDLFNDYICKKVKEDPFYPIHDKTRMWIEKFLREKKSISIENFEKK